MAKQRVVDTKFWADGWVRENLNQLDRYLFLYFLTNEHTKISGLYELPISTMAFETGFSKDELEDTMLSRLNPKMYYENGWVILPNFLRFQNLNNPKIQAGIAREIQEVPREILEKAISYGYPIDRLSHFNSNTNSNTNTNSNALPEWLDKLAWKDWEQYRKEIRKPLSERSRTMQFNFLEEYKDDQKQIINQSIQNSWTGLFPLKGRERQKEQKVYKSKIK